VYLQINTVKYDADREITNIYKNLQTVWSLFFTDMLLFGLLRISIGLSVFGFVANEYQRRAIRLLLTIRNIRSAIRWAIPKVILNYSRILISFIEKPNCMKKHIVCPSHEQDSFEFWIYLLIISRFCSTLTTANSYSPIQH